MNKQNLDVTNNQIEECKNYIFEVDNLDIIIYRLTMSLGFKVNLIGTIYLQKAIKHYVMQPTLKLKFNSVVYPAIAREEKVSEKCVEKDIRNALLNCHSSGTLLKCNLLVGHDFISPAYAPTNAEFISELSVWLKMTKIVNALIK